MRAGKGYTILYVGHAGHDEAIGTLAVAPESIHLVEHEDDARRGARRRSPTRRRSRCSPRRRSRSTTGRASPTGPATQFPELWTATRNDLCFATTNRQAALAGDRGAGRRRRRDRERQLVEHARAGQGRARRPAARSCCASTAPTSSTSPRSATRASSASPPARAHPRISSSGDRHARARRRRRARARHRRGRVLPAAARAARAAARARRRSPRCALGGDPRRGARARRPASPTTAPSTRPTVLAGLGALSRDARPVAGERRMRLVEAGAAARPASSAVSASTSARVHGRSRRGGGTIGSPTTTATRREARERPCRSRRISSLPADADRDDRHAELAPRGTRRRSKQVGDLGPVLPRALGEHRDRLAACERRLRRLAARPARSVPPRSTGTPPSAVKSFAAERVLEQLLLAP